MKMHVWPIALALGSVVLGASGAMAQTQAQEPAPIQLSHFMSAYSVSDIEKVTAFYVEMLDFEVVKDVPLDDGRHFRWLRNGNQGIELVEIPNSTAGPDRSTPPAHLGVRGAAQLMLQVADLEATKAALLARGATLSVDITDVPVLGLKLMFVNDPEGNPLEIVQVTGS